MLSSVEQTRLRISKNTEAKNKSQFGQFLTSARTAVFLDRWNSGGFHFRRVELDAFEIDDSLCFHLTQTLAAYRHNAGFVGTIRKADFIHVSADWLSGGLFAESLPQYTHAILNPPYGRNRTSVLASASWPC